MRKSGDEIVGGLLKKYWKYILLLDSGGAFFGDSLWRVFSDMFWTWRKRGKQWNQ